MAEHLNSGETKREMILWVNDTVDHLHDGQLLVPAKSERSMDITKAKAISKYLSYILRHHPDEVGIELDRNGWTNVDKLINQVSQRFPDINRMVLEYIVATNSKQRFAFNPEKTMIRASQGHSIDIELNYIAQQPPDVLFHGTSEDRVMQIRNEGLKKQQRHHVHLSEDIATALQVGSRHGKPFVLKILSGKMHFDGHLFFVSANNVWLTEHVAPEYIDDLI